MSVTVDVVTATTETRAVPDLGAAALSFPRTNNLEWLRLLFALQVLIEHAAAHLHVQIPEFVSFFPGVPAFFFVSGFLIYASYLNAPGARYVQNRFLRLYPGLVFVTLGGLAAVVLAHGWGFVVEHWLSVGGWFIAQTTLGQAYNPALFRDVGVGAINGSLWTITTEILFYISVPFIVWLERRFRYALGVLLALTSALYALGPRLDYNVYRDKTVYDVLALTPLVWGWMFGLGILAVKHFHAVSRWLKWAPWAVIPLVCMTLWGEGELFGALGNRLGLVYFVCYAALVLYCAFSLPYLRLPFDFSYGIYIWHMPIINAFLVLGIGSMPLAIALTVLLAAVSWFGVERPMLRRKRTTLKSV